MSFDESIKRIIDIAKECGIVEEEYAQTQLIILSAQLNLDPAECFKLAINDLEKCDIEG